MSTSLSVLIEVHPGWRPAIAIRPELLINIEIHRGCQSMTLGLLRPELFRRFGRQVSLAKSATCRHCIEAQPQTHPLERSNSGSFATLAAIRRASFYVRLSTPLRQSQSTPAGLLSEYERPACNLRDCLWGGTVNRRQLVLVTWPAIPIQPDQRTRSGIRVAHLAQMK